LTTPSAPASPTDLEARPGYTARGALVALGRFLFRYRNVVFPVIFLPLILAAPPRYPFGSARADRVLDAFGILLALVGQTLRVLVIGLAYIERGGKDGNIHADTLVQRGIFAHCRNPLYVGNVLMALGVAMVIDSPLAYLVGLPLISVAYLALVLAEEDFLERKFGAEYRDYCSRVNRFLPRLRGLGRTTSEMRFDWRRVIRKEYGTTIAWTSMVIGFLVWERIVNEGYRIVRPDLPAYAGAWGVVVLAYVAARWLKKTGRLGRG
jgi:protein-S-isoprenylcysteine O-methyltransferase Ste14